MASSSLSRTSLSCRPSLLAGLAGLLLAPAWSAAQSTGNRGTDAAPAIQRLPDHAIRDQFTARDLLGREVVDRDGDNVGEVTDIELGAGFASPIVQALGTSRSAKDPNADVRGQRDDSPMSSSPTDRSRTAQQGGEPAVIITAGSILGVGGHALRAPASALSFDERSEKLVLDITGEDLRRLTDEEATGKQGQSAPAGTAGAGVALRNTNPPDDRRLIIEAIAATPELSDVADRINPMVNEDDVVVFGTVHSGAQRRALIDLVERHTDKPVRDRLQVDPSVKEDATGAE